MSLSVCPRCGQTTAQGMKEHAGCQACGVRRVVLLSTETLREVRARGVDVNEWLDAPPPPRTRGECPTVRPCPHLRCKHHNGAAGSCDLDRAELGGMTLSEIASELGVTRERVRQIETSGLRKLKRSSSGNGIR